MCNQQRLKRSVILAKILVRSAQPTPPAAAPWPCPLAEGWPCDPHQPVSLPLVLLRKAVSLSAGSRLVPTRKEAFHRMKTTQRATKGKTFEDKCWTMPFVHRTHSFLPSLNSCNSYNSPHSYRTSTSGCLALGDEPKTKTCPPGRGIPAGTPSAHEYQGDTEHNARSNGRAIGKNYKAGRENED